jgi:hypothetical protein
MPTRTVLVLAALLATAGAVPSHAAAPKPQIVDPKGDAAGNQPGADLVSVTYATTGVGSGRRYVPKKLVVTMTMAGDVVTTPGLTYEVQADTAPCGPVTFSAQQGSPYSQLFGVNGWTDFGSCNDATGSNVELVTVDVSGKTLTWKVSLKALPKELKVGTVLSAFEARIDPTNPLIPFPSNATGTTLGLVDKGTGTGKWRLG